MPEAYQVIARRWRPKQFDEIVGQEHIVRTLKNAITQNRLAHAYLFVGPRGTGKTTTARILAKALNAEGGPSVSPKDDSPLAKSIMAGTCMDVQEIDGASNNSVENIRQLREDCQYAPAQGKFKIYIIDEVHMLSTGAFNALLKTLEEPPPHVKFIFATTESQKVPATIVSRCQRFEFRPIPDAQIAEKLGAIAKVEGIKISAEALQSVARLAQGGMRDAQSILDQLISFCGQKIGDDDVLDVYGLAAAEQIHALAKALAAGDYAALVKGVDELATEGRDLNRVLNDLEAALRDALLEAVRGEGATEKLGPVTRSDTLLRILETLHAGEDAVRTGLNERVNFEVLLLHAAEQGRTRAIDSLIHDLTEISAGLPQDAGQKKISAAPAPKKAEPEPVASHVAEAPPPPREIRPASSPASRLNSADAPAAHAAYERLPASTRQLLEQELRASLRGLRPAPPPPAR
ncbi:MAG TPA: DNA polymerase III subunit gamma/tau [Opitutales bacterium]|nr:DNA polymerase III subunit gamma/tau [Opitutales bacterium]